MGQPLDRPAHRRGARQLLGDVRRGSDPRPTGQRSCKVPAIREVTVTGGEAGALSRPSLRHDTPYTRTPPVEPSGTATGPSILRTPLGEVSRWQRTSCSSSVRSGPGHTLRASRCCVSRGWRRMLGIVATTAEQASNRRPSADQIRHVRLAPAAGGRNGSVGSRCCIFWTWVNRWSAAWGRKNLFTRCLTGCRISVECSAPN